MQDKSGEVRIEKNKWAEQKTRGKESNRENINICESALINWSNDSLFLILIFGLERGRRYTVNHHNVSYRCRDVDEILCYIS